MKKGFALSLFGLICLIVGFFLFIAGVTEISVVFTFCGIGVYLYKKFKKEND
jgi:hypothetical protein